MFETNIFYNNIGIVESTSIYVIENDILIKNKVNLDIDRFERLNFLGENNIAVNILEEPKINNGMCFFNLGEHAINLNKDET